MIFAFEITCWSRHCRDKFWYCIIQVIDNYKFEMLDRNLLNPPKHTSTFTWGGKNHGLSEMQRLDDVGALLGFLSGVLCLEVRQLWSDH